MALDQTPVYGHAQQQTDQRCRCAQRCRLFWCGVARTREELSHPVGFRRRQPHAQFAPLVRCEPRGVRACRVLTSRRPRDAVRSVASRERSGEARSAAAPMCRSVGAHSREWRKSHVPFRHNRCPSHHSGGVIRAGRSRDFPKYSRLRVMASNAEPTGSAVTGFAAPTRARIAYPERRSIISAPGRRTPPPAGSTRATMVRHAHVRSASVLHHGAAHASAATRQGCSPGRLRNARRECSR